MKSIDISLRSAPAAGWREFLPPDQVVDARERWRSAFGALLGVLITALLTRWLGQGGAASPWLVAPIGASAVLVFAAPAAPLAQPWAVIGGNTVSALVGILCVQAFGDAVWVPALAVGLAIALMFALRCLHPPGGACALLVALGGVADLHFALQPVLLNSVLLVAAGIVYNRANGRRYPQRASPPKPETRRRSFTDADLDAVLARYNQVLDVSREDLHLLLEEAQMQAWQRRSGQLRCEQVMSRDPVTVGPGTSMQLAWGLLRLRRLKALPVVDGERRLLGIVTLADFMREANADDHASWRERLRARFRRKAGSPVASDGADTVAQIMSRKVRVASARRPIGDLLSLFASTGHHHVPVIDEAKRLVGMITQSDVVRALAAE